MPASPEGPPAEGRSLRILLVSQFWPSAADPDLGVFVAQVVRELEARGHTVDRAVIDHRGAGRAGDARLLRDAVRLARRHRPDVVFAHFLVPAGLAAVAASLAARAPLVVMAHGQDVENAVSNTAVRRATALVVRRASAVIFNSAYLRERLPLRARSNEIIDCGVDLDAFTPRPRAASDGPVFLFAGSLIERKNIVRLRDAFERLGDGRLIVVGDGPLRPELEGRDRIELRGKVPHDHMPDLISLADVVVLPSEREPLGQILLEAMAMGRSVVATTVGGPSDFVTTEAGALVDPTDVDAIHRGMKHAASLPRPNTAAREAAREHDVKRQAARMEAVLERASGGGGRRPAAAA